MEGRVRIEQNHWSASKGWHPAAPGKRSMKPQLVLAFGSRSAMEREDLIQSIRDAYPTACVTGCSTAGEICGDRVFDDTIVVTALQFKKTVVESAFIQLGHEETSAAAGSRLAAMLPRIRDLRHVLVFSEGLQVNGSELVQGLTAQLPQHISITGGLSADGSKFEQTLVLAGATSRTRTIVAVGFYGPSFRVGYGSLGGWDPFGPERLVTRSRGNVLYELDGQSALALYKTYLGEQARSLPASGLLFPLSIRSEHKPRGVVRTILAIDEATDAITFAGDIPEGCYARLMKANFDRLVDGAIGAARISQEALGSSPDFALLISCVGRKMVLQQRIEEEIEGVRDVVGPAATLAGFYSYGEISPFTPNASCELHNQTMTITTLSEA